MLFSQTAFDLFYNQGGLIKKQSTVNSKAIMFATKFPVISKQRTRETQPVDNEDLPLNSWFLYQNQHPSKSLIVFKAFSYGCV